VTAIRVMGVIIGIGACIVALLLWRVGPSSRSLGTDVRLIPTPPGELAVSPSDVVLAGHDLKPGGRPAKASFAVRNQTGRTLAIELRGLPSSQTLDRDLQLSFRSKGRELTAGPLGELRSFRGPGLLLTSGRSAPVTATVWLKRGAKRTAGQLLDVTLEFAVRVVQGGAHASPAGQPAPG
jgi:hypothetical protein